MDVPGRACRTDRKRGVAPQIPEPVILKPPLQHSEIFAPVIRWHRPCRVVQPTANQNPMIAGGDYTIIQRLSAARLFPHWGNNVGANAPTMQYQIFYGEIRRYYVGTWCICNIVTLPGQIGSAQKFATLAGGYDPPHEKMKKIFSHPKKGLTNGKNGAIMYP